MVSTGAKGHRRRVVGPAGPDSHTDRPHRLTGLAGLTEPTGVRLSGLFLTSGLRHHALFLGKHGELAILARTLGLHRAMAFEHGALVHHQHRRGKVAEHLGRGANFDPLAGGYISADLA